MSTEGAARFFRTMQGLLSDPVDAAAADEGAVPGPDSAGRTSGLGAASSPPVASEDECEREVPPAEIGRGGRGPAPPESLRWRSATAVAPPRPAGPSPSDRRGPCESCVHRRKGASVATATYQALMRSVQPEVRETHTRALVMEAGQQGEAKEELAGQSQMAELSRRDGRTPEMHWSTRPSGSWYCGIEEFDDSYYIGQIRNGSELRCTEFEPIVTERSAHSCSTCAHSRSTPDSILLTLKEMFLGAGGQARALLSSDVQPALRAQAVDEYQACVDGSGFLIAAPAFLPYCAVHSSDRMHEADGRFVVGPVVNADARCAAWEPLHEPLSTRDPQLEALVAHANRLKEYGASIMFDMRAVVSGPAWMDVNHAEGTSRGDIIAHCLRRLQATEETVTGVCTAYTLAIWGTDWLQAPFTGADLLPENRTEAGPRMPPSGSGHEAPRDVSVGAVIAGLGSTEAGDTRRAKGRSARSRVSRSARRSAQQFAIVPGVSYVHPRDTKVRLVVLGTQTGAIAVVQTPAGHRDYDLLTFPSGVWTELRDNGTPLRIALNVQLPSTVYAAW